MGEGWAGGSGGGGDRGGIFYGVGVGRIGAGVGGGVFVGVGVGVFVGVCVSYFGGVADGCSDIVIVSFRRFFAMVVVGGVAI